MTGSSGYIGSVVIKQPYPKGTKPTPSQGPNHETSDEKIKSQDAVPVRGDLKSYDVLSDQSAQADIVLHLADTYAGNFGMDYTEVVRIDNAAVNAIDDGLEGSSKPLVVTYVPMVVKSSMSRREHQNLGCPRRR